MSTLTHWPEAGEQAPLSWSFAAASLLLVMGVLTAWIWVKASTEPLLVSAWQSEVDVALPESQTPTGAGFLLQQAASAMAAGRVVEPRFDNALYFYEAVLAENPADPDALDGVDRVRRWLVAETGRLLQADDWDGADGLVSWLETLPATVPAESDLVRRVRTVTGLLGRADRALLSGELDGDEGALRLFGRVRQIDPDNARANAGLQRVAVAALVQAQDALMAADMAQVDRGLAVARAADAQAPGLDRLTATVASWRRMQTVEALEQRLVAARAALAAGRLVEAPDSAWQLFNAVLAEHPDNAEARTGLDATRAALVQEGWSALQRDDVQGAQRVLEQAAVLGAALVATDLQREVTYRQRLADARAGRFDEVLSVAELTSTRRQAPEYPRAATARGLEGWTELEFTVTEAGTVAAAEVTASSSGQFDAVSLEALAGWRFEPYLEEGRPMPVRAAIRFTFQL